MKITIITDNDYVKGMNILCEPTEGFIIHRALICYMEKGENENGRLEAKRMCDELLLATAEATGKQENMNLAYGVIARSNE